MKKILDYFIEKRFVFFLITVLLTIFGGLLFFNVVSLNFRYSIGVIFFIQLLYFEIFKYIHNLLGGFIHYPVWSTDPESNNYLLVFIPFIGMLVITLKLNEKLNLLAIEMKNQGVVKMEDFKPLPRKSKNLL